MLVVPCSPSNSPGLRKRRWIPMDGCYGKAPRSCRLLFFSAAKWGKLLGCLFSLFCPKQEDHIKQINIGRSCLSFLDHVVNLLPLLVVSHLSFFRLLSVEVIEKHSMRSTHHPTTTMVKGSFQASAAADFLLAATLSSLMLFFLSAPFFLSLSFFLSFFCLNVSERHCRGFLMVFGSVPCCRWHCNSRGRIHGFYPFVVIILFAG